MMRRAVSTWVTDVCPNLYSQVVRTYILEGKIIGQNKNSGHSYIYILNKSIMLTISKFTIANSERLIIIKFQKNWTLLGLGLCS